MQQKRSPIDKRTILAVGLALAVYYVWMVWVGGNPPPEPPPEPPAAEQGVPTEAAASAATTPAAPWPEAAPAPDLPVVELDYDACGFDAEVTTEGGVIHDMELRHYEDPYEVTPLWKWIWQKVRGQEGPWLPYGQHPGPAIVVTEEGRFLELGTGRPGAEPVRVEVVRDDAEALVLRGRTADGIEVTRTLHRQGSGDPCLVDATVSWRNVSGQPWQGELWMGFHDHLPAKTSRYTATSRPVAYYDDEFESFDKTHKLEEDEPREGEVSYLGLANGYFVAVALLDHGSPGRVVFDRIDRPDADPLFGSRLVVPTTLQPGASHDEHLQLLVGPKILSSLKDVRSELSELVRLGFFGFFARILLVLLHFFHGLVGNWGLAIICLTLVVKLVFFPLTQMSFKSSQAMQALQPELKRLKEELKDNPEELNRRTMELFKKNGVNPLGGCLPMLIQMPVWFALYRVLLSSVDLYHTEFLYLKDLSATDPYMLLPTVVVILMVVQQQFMPTGNMDPAQARMMKLMPLIFGFFFFTFPSGLVLYIFVNYVLTILQQWVIKRRFGRNKPAAASQGS